MNNKDNNKKAMFVKTKDQETSETLQALGFQLFQYSNGVWTFINDPEKPLTFENNKMAYSNMLTI